MIRALISMRIRSLLGGKSGSRSHARSVPLALVCLILLCAVAYVFSSIASTLAPGMILTGSDAAYFGIFMLLGFFLVFISAIFVTKSELFECRDTEMLLAMPIDPEDIVASRIGVVMIYNYAEISLIMLPAVIVYGINGGSARGVVGGIIATLLIPPLATALACGIGYLLAIISRRLRYSTLVTTLLSVAFVFAYFWLYSSLFYELDAILEGGAQIDNAPILSVIGSVATLELGPFIVFDVAAILSAYIAWAWLSSRYIRIVTAGGTLVKRVSSSHIIVRRSPLASLVRKEFSRFFTSPIYIINSAIGVIFSAAAAILLLTRERDIAYLSDMITATLGVRGEELLAPMAIAGVAMLCCLNNIAAPTLSLEGKSLGILRSAPIKPATVLLAKLVPHIALTIPVTVISSLLVMRAIHAPVEFWAFFIITPITVNLMIAMLDLIIGVCLPRLDYQSETQVIKQSLATFISIFANFLIGVGIAGCNLYCVIKDEALLGAILTPIVLVLVTLLLSVVLFGACARRYEKL